MKTILVIMLAAALLFVGCSGAPETPVLAEPDAVVQSFKEALSRGKVETSLSLVSDDVVFRQDPVGLTFEGKEQIRDLLLYLVAWNFDWSEASPSSVEGNRVIVSANMRGDHYELLGIQQVRARLEFLVHDGKIGSFLIQENDEDAAKLAELTRGGIGIQVKWEEGCDKGISVLQVIENSPAQEAGIREGDQVVAVDGVSCSQMTRPQEVQLRLMGPVGSEVHLAVVQQSMTTPIDMKLIRADLSGLR